MLTLSSRHIFFQCHVKPMICIRLLCVMMLSMLHIKLGANLYSVLLIGRRTNPGVVTLAHIG